MKLRLFLIVVVFMGHKPCSAYTPVDNILLACGSSENITFQDRTFVPDSQHSSLRLETENSFVVSSNSSGLSPIYHSARTFTSLASYKFETNQKGWHLIRLYFHPLTQSMASASITVVTDTFVLLENFSFKSSSTLFKEYAINVNAKTLTLTFVPSKSSTAFVNAIEVVSIPNEVFSFHDQNHNISSLLSNVGVARETMYRLNMGGSSVTAENDTLYRTWEEDEKYLQANLLAVNLSINPAFLKSSFSVTTEIAPKQVYATAKALQNASVSNLSWVFPVNPNFMYILRMHFCDIISKSKNTLYFNVYINSGIVVKNLNLSALASDVGLPYVMDFFSNSSKGSDSLSLRIEPSDLGVSQNAIINGLEIMKMSNEIRSLDGLSSVEDIILLKSASKIPKLAVTLGIVLGTSALLLLIGFFYYCCCYKVAFRSKTTTQNNGLAGALQLANPGRFCRKFTFQEIQLATNNFEEGSLLGTGGFGKVYMGKLENGTKVAIKRANPESKQGLHEFQNEIRLLSKLHHHHLVTLLGYCNEGMEMILVYEYMANGALSNHLYGPNVAPLSWKRRLKICIGAARGLHHLHTGAADKNIIHRDLKTANILLDENFVAKVSDFGISRKGPALGKSHVTTLVKGSFGYLDPEYFRSRHLTEKSDVYSFGVVLMEILCGRPALDHNLPTQEINLAGWALSCHENGVLHQIIDPNLIGRAKLASVMKVWDVAKKCLAHHSIKRPTMGYVMCCLEDALHLDLRNIDDGLNSNFSYYELGATSSESEDAQVIYD